MLRVSNLKLGIDEDISLLKKLILKKLKIEENELIKYFSFVFKFWIRTDLYQRGSEMGIR